MFSLSCSHGPRCAVRLGTIAIILTIRKIPLACYAVFFGQHAMTLGDRARALIAGSAVIIVHYIREPLPILP